MSTQPVSVSVTTPVGQALAHMKRLLFQPFEPGKWLVIGFCAWLATLGEGGFSPGIHFQLPGSDGNFRRDWERAKDFVLGNLDWLLPLVAAIVIAALIVGLVLLWLTSRGRFMFLHCVALQIGEVSRPWHQFARQGNSLFWFRLVVGVIGSVFMLTPLVAIVAGIVRMVDNGRPTAGGVLGVMLLTLALGGIAAAFGVVSKLTKDFVVPIMFLRRRGCLAGWGELLGLLWANPGRFLLYLLFQVVLAFIIGTLVLIGVLITCCLAGCLMAIPYLGTVILLPVLVFSRAYSLHYLAQYGAEFNALPPCQSPGTATPAPPLAP